MRTSDSIDKIAPALLAARAAMKAIGKSGDNKFDKYRYANLLDYIEGTEGPLATNGLMVITGVPEVTNLETRVTKNGGNEYPVKARLEARVLHSSGQWIEIDGHGEGQDRGDKGLYKAITGGRKYVIACLFGLATTDDPEDDKGEKPPANPPPAQRETPAKPPMSEVKRALSKTVLEWAECQREKVPAAIRECAKKAGVVLKPGETMTDEQAKKTYEWVVKKCGENAVFAEAIA